MALHRKMDALLRLDPDIAVISECAEPQVLETRGLGGLNTHNCIWMGSNPNKGLGVFAFNGFRLARHTPCCPTLKFILPVHVAGRCNFNLLAVWAQNASAGITRKHQLGPLRRSLGKYREFLGAAPLILAGDFNNNVIWDRPGWRINWMTTLNQLGNLGQISAYHAMTGEEQGREKMPTLYWRDRKKDGPTYHIDYVFVPRDRVGAIRDCRIGRFEDWCGNGLSDHAPVVVDIDL